MEYTRENIIFLKRFGDKNCLVVRVFVAIRSVKTSYFQDFDDVVKNAIEVAKEEGFAIDGQRLVITAGVPFGTPGSTNVLRIVNVN